MGRTTGNEKSHFYMKEGNWFAASNGSQMLVLFAFISQQSHLHSMLLIEGSYQTDTIGNFVPWQMHLSSFTNYFSLIHLLDLFYICIQIINKYFGALNICRVFFVLVVKSSKTGKLLHLSREKNKTGITNYFNMSSHTKNQ